MEWDSDGPSGLPPRLIAGGRFQFAGETAANRIAMWGGSSWQAMGTGMTSPSGPADPSWDTRVDALVAWDPDGTGPLLPQPVAVGLFFEAGGVSARDVARWTGSAWVAMGTTQAGLYSPRALTTWDPDGAGPQAPILVAGGLNQVAGGSSTQSCVTYWTGSTWADLGPDIDGYAVFALCSWDPDGSGPLTPRLVAGGEFDTAGGVTANGIAMWDGVAWSPLGSGMDRGDGVGGGVAALVSWDPDGIGIAPPVLVAAGSFVSAGGVSAIDCAYWNGSWQAMSTSAVPGVNSLAVWDSDGFAGTPSPLVRTPGSQSGSGGSFEWVASRSSAGAAWSVFGGDERVVGTELCTWDHDGSGLTPDRLVLAANAMDGADFVGARVYDFDGTAWRSVGPPPTIRTFVEYAGKAVAAGEFAAVVDDDAVVASRILAWDGVERSTFGTGFDGTVRALIAGQNTSPPFLPELIAAGSFTTAGGVAASRVARWQESLSILNPPEWEPMGTGFNGTVYALERYDGDYCAAGAFILFSGGRVARWTGSAWSSLGGALTTPNGTVHALKTFGASLYAGGDFDALSSLGFPTTGALARWNGSTWSEVTTTDLNGVIYAMTVHNGELIVGGQFTGVSGSPNIVKFNGASFSSIGAGGAVGTVRALLSKNGILYAAGDITSIGGVAVSRIAQWDGAAWAPVNSGADSTVHALLGYRSEVHAGGSFATVRGGTIDSPGWARMSEDGIPWIARHPAMISDACLGATVSFEGRAADGYEGLQYTWKRNGVPVTMGPTPYGSVYSTTGTRLSISHLRPADAGSFTVEIGNSCGSATSFAAVLSVCAADFNCSGGVTIDDIFSFLNGWFAQDPRANIDGAGGVAIDDIFTYLNLWFAGC